ncbi:MAG: hypothetical protein ACJAWL_002716 [Motiliproteus sp.]|jgi:hypothetical protein
MKRHDDHRPLKPLYYALLTLGCGGLLGWFYLLRHWQLMEWLAQFGPQSHTGSMNLLAVMLWLMPALFVWKYYLRWLNSYFDIGGQFDQDRHDAQYHPLPSDSLSKEGPAKSAKETDLTREK